uniref:Mitochondrial-processing peptidase subunit alpha n=1 Tax=Plectus sambesii TaxID=2011161 RepID=A0A914WZ74_9BILA
MIQGLSSMRLTASRCARWRCNQFRGASSSKTPPAPAATYATATQRKATQETAIHKIPLSQELPGLPKAVYTRAPDTDPFATQITTLDNGLRIATEAHFGEYCTIGVAIDAGSRYEIAYPSGISHFLEKLAFNSTLNRSRDETFGMIERHGGLIDCQSTKDTFVYASSCHINGLDDVLGVIADAVLRPQITDEELETARTIVQFDVEDMNRRPDCEPLITDWIHAAAYKGNTLGLPKYCPEENLNKITRQIIFSFMKAHFTPKRIVVSGVGVSHDKMVEAAKKHFDVSTTTWAKDNSVVLPKVPSVDTSIAQYTGGE